MRLQAEALGYSIFKESETRVIFNIQQTKTWSIFKTYQQSCKQKRWSNLPDTQGIGGAIKQRITILLSIWSTSKIINNKPKSKNNRVPFPTTMQTPSSFTGILNAWVLWRVPFKQYTIKMPGRCLPFQQYSTNPRQVPKGIGGAINTQLQVIKDVKTKALNNWRHNQPSILK